MSDAHKDEKAEPEEHGYGDDSDCLCGRNFDKVRGLREHITKARLAAAKEERCTR